MQPERPVKPENQEAALAALMKMAKLSPWQRRRRRGRTHHAPGQSTRQGAVLDANGRPYAVKSIPAGYGQSLGRGVTSDMSEHARRRALRRHRPLLDVQGAE